MQPIDIDATLRQIVADDPRYTLDAYIFLREALAFTQRVSSRVKRPEKEQHVSGKELLDGIRDHALKTFGPMASTVLAEWGVHSCDDFGEIVFNMIK